MKKLIFISLLVAIAYCKAADPHESWQQAIQNIPNWQQADTLNLNNRHIGTIPADLNLPQLRELNLVNSQINAIPAGLNLPQLQELFLINNQIDAIGDLNLPRLEWLDLSGNYIEHIDPGIFKRFPRLRIINLSRNPLTRDNIEQLKKAATATRRNIEIIADDLTPTSEYIKGD